MQLFYEKVFEEKLFIKKKYLSWRSIGAKNIFSFPQYGGIECEDASEPRGEGMVHPH